MQIKQRIVQTLIEEIIVGFDKDSNKLVLTIHCRGGRHSELRVKKPQSGEHERRASKDAIKIIESMSGRYSNEEIAYKSANKDGQWLTMSEAAAYLGVSNHVIRRLIRDKVLPATQVVTHAPYQIRAEDLKSERVKRAVKNRNNRPCRQNRDDRNLVIPGT